MLIFVLKYLHSSYSTSPTFSASKGGIHLLYNYMTKKDLERVLVNPEGQMCLQILNSSFNCGDQISAIQSYYTKFKKKLTRWTSAHILLLKYKSIQVQEINHITI